MEKRYDLRSDTCTLPTKEMREAIFNAEVGDQGYGEDVATNQLEEYCAKLFGKEAAVFMPSGTMSDQVALRCWTNPGDEVIIDESYHINYFQGAQSVDLGKIILNTCKTKDGIIHVSDIKERLNSRMHGGTFTIAKLLSLENTINSHGGRVFPLEVLKEDYEFCKANGIKLHLDGERIMNACVATGILPSEYAKYTDTITMSFSKGLGGPFGSIIMGDKETMLRARKFRRWYGGHLHQCGFMAAAAYYAVTHNIERLKEDHDNAKLLAELVKKENSEVIINEPETNIVMFDISKLNFKAENFVNICKEYGVLLFPYNEYIVRAITCLNVNEEDIRICAMIMNRELKKIKGEK